MNALGALSRPMLASPAAGASSPVAGAPSPPAPLDTFARAPLALVPSRAQVLHSVAAPVEKVDATAARLLADMSAVMHDKGGCGIAGPQVGIPYRMIVVNAGGGELRLVNPEIVSRSGVSPSLEGCLSLPGRMGLVWRSSHVVVKAQDDKGQNVTVDARGLKARCLQHEIDHLDGKLFPEKAFMNGMQLMGTTLGATVGLAMHGAVGAAVGGAAGYAVTWAIDRLHR